ncbi:hypothetical protein B0H14DRAFT_2581241 [Mycena olivaceomarginata]|nr:hypothetical protein B0H14DRAFT_2581241 [Mycena olivaceomarginata]
MCTEDKLTVGPRGVHCLTFGMHRPFNSLLAGACWCLHKLVAKSHKAPQAFCHFADVEQQRQQYRFSWTSTNPRVWVTKQLKPIQTQGCRVKGKSGADKHQKSVRQLEYHKPSVSSHKTAKTNTNPGLLGEGKKRRSVTVQTNVKSQRTSWNITNSRF